MSIGIGIAGTLAAGFALWRLVRRGRFFLHLFQLEGYRLAPTGGWLAQHSFDAVVRVSHGVGLAIIAALVWLEAAHGFVPGAALLLWCIAFSSSRRYRRDQPKKPLVWTARMKRIAAGTVLASIAWGCAAWTALGGGVAGFLAAFWAADLLAPISILLAGFVLEPVEAFIRAGFKRQARARLRERPDLRIVAVTGSYGKTSVKFALAELLGQRFHVLATPGSFNTPMGICKVINNDLRPEHQVLILEMGIRHPGDMAELCAIARPHVAIITGIGVAHLESMGSMEAIASEKGMLVEQLLPDGTAVLSADDPFSDAIAQRATGTVVRVSAQGNPGHALRAEDVRFDASGMRFDVIDATGGRAELRTGLLGRHHISNLLLALAVGQTFGLRLRTMAHAARRMKPVAHRLAVREENGFTVIDDAFNSNPVGARNAVEVLSQFPGRRIIVTPGMVELGAVEVEENRAFGGHIARGADVVYLVGPLRTRPIRDGLAEAGFAENRIHVVQTLFEAREMLVADRQSGDVVLYENDLPDQYTEK